MFRSLRTRKGREATGFFLIEGRRLCTELLKAGVPAELLLLSARHAEEGKYSDLAEQFAASGARVLRVPARDLERISDTVHSQGIVAAARWEELRLERLHFPRRAVVVALDRVSDPGNVGTVIRSAAWFGASAVLLGQGCADLLNPKTVRSTMGGMFHVPVCRGVILRDALEHLKRTGFKVAVADAGGSPDWRTWGTDERSALVLGSEAHGVDPSLRGLADRIIAIPRKGAGESLNVAACAAILLSAI